MSEQQYHAASDELLARRGETEDDEEAAELARQAASFRTAARMLNLSQVNKRAAANLHQVAARLNGRGMVAQAMRVSTAAMARETSVPNLAAHAENLVSAVERAQVRQRQAAAKQTLAPSKPKSEKE